MSDLDGQVEWLEEPYYSEEDIKEMEKGMNETYTVKSVMPTGQKSPMFGEEYYIQFDEIDTTFKLWFKKQPEPGSSITGTIEGTKFKKEKKEWSANGSTPSASTQTVSSGKPAYKANSDGQRQGMCINNAANYINSRSEHLSAEDWASQVHKYAQELYALGDLSSDTLNNVKEVFKGAEVA